MNKRVHLLHVRGDLIRISATCEAEGTKDGIMIETTGLRTRAGASDLLCRRGGAREASSKEHRTVLTPSTSPIAGG